MTEKERKKPIPRGTQSSSRRVVRYRDGPGRDDQAYQAINVDLSTVQGAAVLMAAAALRIAGNPENQGTRLWGQLAFGELREDSIDPTQHTIRDMLFIDDQLHGYNTARHSFRDLRPGDDYSLGDAVIPNPTIPARAESRRRKSIPGEPNRTRLEKAHYARIADARKQKKVIGETSWSQHMR